MHAQVKKKEERKKAGKRKREREKKRKRKENLPRGHFKTPSETLKGHLYHFSWITVLNFLFASMPRQLMPD